MGKIYTLMLYGWNLSKNKLTIKNCTRLYVHVGHKYYMDITAHVMIQIHRGTTNILPGSSSCEQKIVYFQYF